MRSEDFGHIRDGIGSSNPLLIRLALEALERVQKMRRRGLFNCFICWDQGKRVDAVKLCTLHNKPVCEKHAAGCIEDGHEAVELP